MLHYYKEKEPTESGKKLLAAILAGTIILSGGSVVAKLVKSNNKDKNDSDNVPTSSTVEYNYDEYEKLGLLLLADFDINDDVAVTKRAESIYNISNKKYSVGLIKNLIYYFAGLSDKINLGVGRSDLEKYKLLQGYSSNVYNIFSSLLTDDIKAMSDIEEGVSYSVLDDQEIYAYMFMSKGEAKKKSIELAVIVKRQLDDIAKGNSNNFTSNANDYYNKVKEIRDLKNISDGEKVIIGNQIKATNPLFAPYLSSDKKPSNKNSALYADAQNDGVNNLLFKTLDDLGIDYAQISPELLNNDCKKEIPSGEKNVPSDKVVAENYIKNSNNTTTTKKVDNGGKSVTKSSSVISSGKTTTNVYTSSFVASVPTGTSVVTEKGGTVISEWYNDADADIANKYVDADNTTTKVVDNGGQKVLN